MFRLRAFIWKALHVQAYSIYVKGPCMSMLIAFMVKGPACQDLEHLWGRALHVQA